MDNSQNTSSHSPQSHRSTDEGHLRMSLSICPTYTGGQRQELCPRPPKITGYVR